MKDSLSLHGLSAALAFPFRAPNGQSRFLTGAGVMLAGMFIPVLPLLLVYGYAIKVMRQAIRGELAELPEWNDWGRLAFDGLRGGIIGLVFLGPGLVVMLGGMLLYGVTWFSAVMILSNSRASDPEPLGMLLVFAALGVLFLSMFLSWLLSLAGAAPLPVALAHFVAQDRLGAAFDLRAWSRLIRADRWGYLAGWVALLGLVGLTYLAFMLTYLSGVFCCLVTLVSAPLGFYLLVVGAALFGQFYRDGCAPERLAPSTESA